MPAIGLGLAWLGYSFTIWGYCLVRGYDVTLGQLMNPVHPVTWKAATQYTIAQGVLLPTGAGAANQVGNEGTLGPASGSGGNEGTAGPASGSGNVQAV